MGSIRRSYSLQDEAASVIVYVSGNTPRDIYIKLKQTLEGDTIGVSVISIWGSPLVGGPSSARWGAGHPAASWVDLWIGAGGAAGAWACIVQSNWCRVIDFL